MFCFYIFVVYNCKRLTFNQNTIFMKTAKLKVIAEPLPTYPIPEFVIGLRHKGEPMQDRHKISGSRDVFDLMKKVFNSDSIDWVESFVVMCMNRANKAYWIL